MKQGSGVCHVIYRFWLRVRFFSFGRTLSRIPRRIRCTKSEIKISLRKAKETKRD